MVGAALARAEVGGREGSVLKLLFLEKAYAHATRIVYGNACCTTRKAAHSLGRMITPGGLDDGERVPKEPRDESTWKDRRAVPDATIVSVCAPHIMENIGLEKSPQGVLYGLVSCSAQFIRARLVTVATTSTTALPKGWRHCAGFLCLCDISRGMSPVAVHALSCSS